MKNYDFQRFLRLFNEIIKENSNLEISELPGWAEIFYNNDKTMKTIEEILTHEDIKHVDNRFLEAFFSNQYFLETIKFEKLEFRYQTIVLDSIKNTYLNEIIREKNIHDTFKVNLISKKEYADLINAVEYNLVYYKNIMYMYLNMMDKNNEFVQNYSAEIGKTI